MPAQGSNATSPPSVDGGDPQLEACEASLLETVIRASISMRGHLVAALQTMREMSAAAKEGDLEAIRRLNMDAEALLAENQMLGLRIDRAPSVRVTPFQVTYEDVENIFGAQRALLAARDVVRAKRYG